MPPDVVKPLASTTVGDIAVIVRRTGMIWKSFEPLKGIMSAEGGPHVISSHDQKGLGCVLQYRCLDGSLTERVKEQRRKAIDGKAKRSKNDQRQGFSSERSLINRFLWPVKNKQSPPPGIDEERVYAGGDEKGEARSKTNLDTGVSETHGIHSYSQDYTESDASSPWPETRFLNYTNIDKTFFGLVPGDPALNIKDFRHRTVQECFNEMKDLCNDGDMIYEHLRQHNWMGRYEFNDMLVMVPEAWRQRGKPRGEYRTKDYNVGVLYWTTKSFAELVEKYLSGETFLEKLRYDDRGRPKTYHDGDQKDAKHPARQIPPTEEMQFVRESMQLLKTATDLGNINQSLEDIHSRHEHTTRYFVSISHRISFHSILRMHFSNSVWASDQARDDLKRKHNGVLPTSDGHPWRNRNIELYFCYLPRHVHLMARGAGVEQCDDEELVTEAWLMLMARGYLFQTLHELKGDFEGDYLPPEWYGSRLPIWFA